MITNIFLLSLLLLYKLSRFSIKVTDRMEELKKQYDEKSAQKEELRKRAEMLEVKLDRAGKLVSGLAGERDRWEASVTVCLLL